MDLAQCGNPIVSSANIHQNLPAEELGRLARGMARQPPVVGMARIWDPVTMTGNPIGEPRF